MSRYRVILQNADGNVVEAFTQSAASLRLALEVSAARLTGLASGHGEVAVSATVALLAVPPSFVRVAPGDYETADGMFRLVQLDGGATRAWNVEYGDRWIEAQIDRDPEHVTSRDFSDLIVDGAATKRDALALFSDWWASSQVAV